MGNANNLFDTKFQKLLKELIEIAFGYVNNNDDEVNNVYVIGLIESGYFYKAFYKIDNIALKSHQINTISKMQYDISKERSFRMLSLGNEILKNIENLFLGDSRAVPSMLKLVYQPKTGKFDSSFSYDKTFSNQKNKTAQDVYEEWFNEIEKTT
ncbi:Uncharacterised protein [Sphingobacterium spiritivorum]|uniref:DUF600 domain-containing protein n=1 Tax=Sphingobacterium spiritivorum TaxID=258 RepID=A0A380BPF0_SPHSI|nr:hypothetical protein [Sphingobacterium spiritivorum]SUJ04692.1 Uncharacterised protein [Sphingobacterium spiritivorum]